MPNASARHHNVNEHRPIIAMTLPPGLAMSKVSCDNINHYVSQRKMMIAWSKAIELPLPLPLKTKKQTCNRVQNVNEHAFEVPKTLSKNAMLTPLKSKVFLHAKLFYKTCIPSATAEECSARNLRKTPSPMMMAATLINEDLREVSVQMNKNRAGSQLHPYQLTTRHLSTSVYKATVKQSLQATLLYNGTSGVLVFLSLAHDVCSFAQK